MLTAFAVALVVLGIVVFVFEVTVVLDPDDAPTRLRRLLTGFRANPLSRRGLTTLARNVKAGVDFTTASKRAQAYLRRVAILTRAEKIAGYYVLEIGDSKFYVNDRQIARSRRGIPSSILRKQTCFYIPQQGMPAEEKIATALLHLKNNPALFDSWARQTGSYKANGEMFNWFQPPLQPF
jgi:hypothetical protein